MAHTPNTNPVNPPRVFYSPSYKTVINNLVGHTSMFNQCANALTIAIEAAQSRQENEITAVLGLMDDLLTNTIDALETDLVDLQMLAEKTKLDAYHAKHSDKGGSK